MEKKMNLMEELLKRETFSVASVQEEFGVSYKELRNCVREMEKNGRVKMTSDGLTYAVVIAQSDATQSKKSKARSPIRRPPSIILNESGADKDDDSDDEEDEDDDLSVDELIAKRRRELMERLARMGEDDDKDDDDEDDDDEDDDEENDGGDGPGINFVLEYEDGSLEYCADTFGDCKLIEGINYAEEKAIARKIANRFGKEGYKLTLKAIQYGRISIGYVFDYPPQKKDKSHLGNFTEKIKSAINVDEVAIVSSQNYDTVYVLVKHDCLFDPLCKKVLRYWIMRNGGRASIASAQRGLGIGFYRAGRIMEQLQKFGCVEQPAPTDDVSKPLHVKIDLQEIDILFPKFLGWD